MPTPDPAAFTRDLEDALTQLDAGDMALPEAQQQIQQAHDRHVKAVAVAGMTIGTHGIERTAPEPTRSPDDGEPTGPRYSECVRCHGPIERFTPPHDLFWAHFDHPADDHDALPVSRWTFDRPGFLLSLAMAPGETTDLSRLADLAQAAIR